MGAVGAHCAPCVLLVGVWLPLEPNPLLPAQEGHAGHAAAVPVLPASCSCMLGTWPVRHSRFPVWAARVPPPNTPHALRHVLKEGGAHGWMLSHPSTTFPVGGCGHTDVWWVATARPRLVSLFFCCPPLLLPLICRPPAWAVSCLAGWGWRAWVYQQGTLYQLLLLLVCPASVYKQPLCQQHRRK